MSTIETLTTEVEAAQAADTTAQATYEAADQALSDFVNSLPSSQDREGLPEHREVSMYYRCEGGIKRTDREPQIGEVILVRVPRRGFGDWLSSLLIEVTKVNSKSVVGLPTSGVGDPVRVPWIPGEGYTDERGYEVVRTVEEQATYKALNHLRTVAFEAKVKSQQAVREAEQALKEAEQAAEGERRQAEREELLTDYLAAYGSRDALDIFASAEAMNIWINGKSARIGGSYRRELEIALKAADFFAPVTA